jgi:hypothetical protein
MAQTVEQLTETEQVPDDVLAGITAKRLTTDFHHVRRHQDKVIGNVDVQWDVIIAHRRIILIDQSFVFSVRNRRRIFDRITIVASSAVHLWLDIYAILNGNRIFLEARAEWHDRSVGERRRLDV